MSKFEKTVAGMEYCLSAKHPIPCGDCPYFGSNEFKDYWSCRLELMRDALEILKVQESIVPKPEKLEEITTKWLDKMTAEERLKEIAVILDDWDGYRTAKGLGNLINEVWAYALYPVKKEGNFPHVMSVEEAAHNAYSFLHRPDSVKPVFVQFRDEIYGDESLTPPWRGGVNQRALLKDANRYGRDFVFWTDRPSAEQMKEVEWDG